MIEDLYIKEATVDDSPILAVMVGELLNEIMTATGSHAFKFNLEETTVRLKEFIDQGRYFVLIARAGGGGASGFVAVYECCVLYAEGRFGTMPELYVRPPHRSQGIGRRLIEGVKAYAARQGWTRIEVTPPPLPQFGKTLAFYQREGFTAGGGHKLRMVL
jgi:GNAT superfamily N-acetyltransferase